MGVAELNHSKTVSIAELTSESRKDKEEITSIV